MKKQFKGVYPALLTPYDTSGNINYSEINKLIEYELKGGVSGFFIMGTSSEMLLLSESERRECVERVVEAVAGRAQVIAQIGYLSTNDAVSMAKFAYSCGVDAFSAIPPIYFRYRKEEIVRYYQEVASAVDLPFLAYNIPCYTGMNLLEKDYREIFKIPNLVGWKESSSNYNFIEEVLGEFPDKIMLIGNDAFLTNALSLGGKGAIGSTYNLIPAPFVEICRLAESGEWEKAKKIQEDVNKAIAILDSFGGVPAVKAALDSLGFSMNGCRRPFRVLLEKEKKELLKMLGAYLEKYAV